MEHGGKCLDGGGAAEGDPQGGYRNPKVGTGVNDLRTLTWEPGLEDQETGYGRTREKHKVS